ncbi:MAG: ABC transporter permease [Enterococcus sp.]
MLNFIRGDIYRLLRTRAFWIAELLILTLVVTDLLPGNEPSPTSAMAPAINGLTAIDTNLNGKLLIYMLPLIIMILGSEYAKGTLKNLISSGISRSQYVLNKFASFGAVLFLQMALIAGLSFVTGSIIYRSTGIQEVTDIFNHLFYFFCVWFILMAIATVTLVVLYASKSIVLSILISLIFPFGILFFHLTHGDWEILKYLDLFTTLLNVTSSTLNDFTLIRPGLIGSLITIIAGLFVADWIFKRQEY